MEMKNEIASQNQRKNKNNDERGSEKLISFINDFSSTQKNASMKITENGRNSLLILVVDDSAPTRKIVRRVLNLHGHQVSLEYKRNSY